MGAGLDTNYSVIAEFDKNSKTYLSYWFEGNDCANDVFNTLNSKMNECNSPKRISFVYGNHDNENVHDAKI
eukprot:Awhi_evm1s4233